MAVEQTRGQEPGEPFQRISAEQAKEMIDKGNTRVIDVRTPEEFSTGRIPGAQLIPVDDFFSRVEELPHDCDLIIVCSVGQRSALACEIAAAAGHTRLYNVDGGTDAWIANNYPVER